jgi:hypothetical protein
MKQSDDPVFRGIVTADDFKRTWGKIPPLPRPNYFYGIDLGIKEGDKTVIATAKTNGAGITHIVFDEYANFPDYKWYRNPIKWWNWRRSWKIIEKDIAKGKKDGKIWTNFED